MTSIGLPRQCYRRRHPTGGLPPGQDRPKTPPAWPPASTDVLIYRQTVRAGPAPSRASRFSSWWSWCLVAGTWQSKSETAPRPWVPWSWDPVHRIHV